MKNIIETATDNTDFSTLVTALKAAELVSMLSGPGLFTVFAPTNAAFSKIPDTTLTEVLADKEKLTSILKYHVVAGKVMSQEVATMAEAVTLEGSPLKITSDNGVMINDARVVSANRECTNGVIHASDTVLIPKG
jgi:uncharacterized surface protein with fasciclin (FAS1) repeats